MKNIFFLFGALFITGTIIANSSTTNPACYEYANNATNSELEQLGAGVDEYDFDSIWVYYYNLCDDYGSDGLLLPIVIQ